MDGATGPKLNKLIRKDAPVKEVILEQIRFNLYWKYKLDMAIVHVLLQT